MPHRPIREVIQGQTLVTLPPGATVREAAALMSDRNIGSIPVIENDTLLGIFTERDVMKRVVAQDLDPKSTTLDQVMTTEVETVSPHLPVSHALHLMREGDHRHLPVVENDRVVGIISKRDGQALEKLDVEQSTGFRESVAHNLR